MGEIPAQAISLLGNLLYIMEAGLVVPGQA